jgi:hypothetical protein
MQKRSMRSRHSANLSLCHAGTTLLDLPLPAPLGLRMPTLHGLVVGRTIDRPSLKSWQVDNLARVAVIVKEMWVGETGEAMSDAIMDSMIPARFTRA